MYLLPLDHFLAALLPIIYLFDCILWLEHDEVAVSIGDRGVTAIRFGSGWTLAGRRPVLMNPLLPFRLAIKAKWRLSENGTPGDAEIRQQTQDLHHALLPVGMTSSVSALVGIVPASLALLAGRSELFLICWAIAVLFVLTGGGIALARYRRLPLSRDMLLWTTLVAALCFPQAGGLARNLAGQRKLALTLPGDAEALLEGAERAQFDESFLQCLKGIQHGAAEGSVTALTAERLISAARGSEP